VSAVEKPYRRADRGEKADLIRRRHPFATGGGKIFAAQVVVIVGILIVWEAAVTFTDMPVFVLPAPTAVARALIAQRALIASNAVMTFAEALSGLIAAVGAASLAAVPLGLSRNVRHVILPILMALQSIPLLGIAPFIVFWLGTGFLPKAVLAAVLAFLPISIRLSSALWSVDEQTELFMRTLGGARIKILLYLRFPAALPGLLDSLRLAVPGALVGALVGEFMGSSRGLGFQLLAALGRLDLSLAVALLFVLSLAALTMHSMIAAMEQSLLCWLPQHQR
jgi:ABC-type nitrate/sulfonate/bicarbonate transport system permease component